MFIYDGDVIEYWIVGSIYFNVFVFLMIVVIVDKLYLNYGESGRV